MIAKKNRGLFLVLLSVSERIFEYFTRLLLVLILIVIPLQVFCRFVLKSSLEWPDEAAPFLLAWITFTGAVVAMRNNEHISFDVLVGKMRGKLKLCTVIVRDLIVLFFLFVLSYFSIPIIRVKWNTFAYTFDIPKGFLYTCVLMGGSLMFILTVLHLARNIQEYFNQNRDQDKHLDRNQHKELTET